MGIVYKKRGEIKKKLIGRSIQLCEIIVIKHAIVFMDENVLLNIGYWPTGQSNAKHVGEDKADFAFSWDQDKYKCKQELDITDIAVMGVLHQVVKSA